jgi:hypothetical protein
MRHPTSTEQVAGAAGSQWSPGLMPLLSCPISSCCMVPTSGSPRSVKVPRPPRAKAALCGWQAPVAQLPPPPPPPPPQNEGSVPVLPLPPGSAPAATACPLPSSASRPAGAQIRCPTSATCPTPLYSIRGVGGWGEIESSKPMLCGPQQSQPPSLQPFISACGGQRLSCELITMLYHQLASRLTPIPVLQYSPAGQPTHQLMLACRAS